MMLEVRYQGVDPRLIPPELGPVAVIVEGHRLDGYIDERQMDPLLIDLIGPVTMELMKGLAALSPSAPRLGQVVLERTPGMLLQARLIKPEFTDDGAVVLRVPEHSMSPAVATAFKGLGTQILSNLVVPDLGGPNLL